MSSLTRNFTAYEFRCRCMRCIHRDGRAIDRELVDKLQLIRDVYGKTMAINSGLRCFDHNRFVGGAKSSYHLKGMACDVAVTDRVGRIIVVREAIQLGLSVGLNNSFIHIDNRPMQRIFTY